MEVVGPFGWHQVDGFLTLKLREKLAHFESRTWNEILVQSNKQNHAVDKNRLSRVAQRRLEALQADDVDSLVSLRLSGRERVWGILRGAILDLLWWDPEHQVYPSLKKHT